MGLTRRDALKVAAVGGAAIALPLERAFGEVVYANRMAESELPAPYTVPFSVPPVLKPLRQDLTTDYYRLTMEPVLADVLPGYKTPMWGYGGSVPGPTIRATQGRQARIRFVNNLPAKHPTLGYTPWTSVHLHGSASLPQYDGYASDITNPGQWKDYRYPNWQPQRTLWYHDHGLHHTAENVSMGLAGQYHLVDALEYALPIPKGEFDVPLIVSDAMFTADGGLLYDNNDVKGMYGDVITVNGRPWPLMKVKRRKYRFRILNASVSRSYKWSLDNGSLMKVIATDAGLMQAPQNVPSLRHGVAERYEVVIDFAKYPPGTRIALLNTSPKNNTNFTNTDKVMMFEVTDEPFLRGNNSVPAVLNPNAPAMLVPESEAVATRKMLLHRDNGMWKINGQTWDDVVASGFKSVLASPVRDTVEIWELSNPSGGWHHPLHIHFIDFRILSRNGRPPLKHELGAKDVVFLGENETVRVLIKFEKGAGKYMIHCHNLVHEDHDMMGQFEILDEAGPGDDPLSDPCHSGPETEL